MSDCPTRLLVNASGTTTIAETLHQDAAPNAMCGCIVVWWARDDPTAQAPRFLMTLDLVFLIQLARIATRERSALGQLRTRTATPDQQARS